MKLTTMLKFFSRPQQRRYPTIREALVQSGVADAADPARVGVSEKHGNYAGRRVNFFQAYETGHPDRPLGSGHVEQEGAVVVNNQPGQAAAAPLRELANRATHTDDERLVFWDADKA